MTLMPITPGLPLSPPLERPHLPQSVLSLAAIFALVLSPEDGGGVTIDFLEEVTDVLQGCQPIVGVESELAISPAQRPAPGCLGVAEPRDGKSRPFRAHALAPRRAALDDRQVPGPDVALHADLLADVLRDALLAAAPDPSHVQIRPPLLHH